MEGSGASIVIYSTPCLFAAQNAIQSYLKELIKTAKLPDTNTIKMDECKNLLIDLPINLEK
jgi:hypothetical protein